MKGQKQRLYAQVTGRVQGVSFRFFTQLRAKELGLAGWVRNRPDGSVEVVAEGDPNDLEALLVLLHQGPPAARVEDVAAQWFDSLDEYSDFNIR